MTIYKYEKNETTDLSEPGLYMTDDFDAARVASLKCGDKITRMLNGECSMVRFVSLDKPMNGKPMLLVFSTFIKESE